MSQGGKATLASKLPNLGDYEVVHTDVTQYAP